MKDLEKLFYETDFSKHTDLKSKLADKLFGAQTSNKVVSFPFAAISDDDAEMVSAARGMIRNELEKKDRED